MITVIVYHFVRDLKRSRYPDIKGLSIEKFRGQLDYIRKHYRVIRIEELMEAIDSGNHALPHNSLILTFDDGYADHFSQVFPLLDKLNIQGCFYPPARAVMEHKVLDVNKIHFVLASVPDKGRIVEYIFSALDEHRAEYSLESNSRYYERLAIPNRFDVAEVIFIKRILQRELPEGLRREIVDSLFRKFVTSDETAFACELYLSLDQLKCMQRHGMHIGSHGFDHYWLSTLDEEHQCDEIQRSLDFLREIGCDMERWTISYPYGDCSESLLRVAGAMGCRIGFTTETRLVDLKSDNPLALPRLDTNDLPCDADAEPTSSWTLLARQGSGGK